MSDLIGPSFYELHHQINAGGIDEVWLPGGRGSLKSSFISIKIGEGLQRDHQAHAVIGRRYANDILDSVFGQMQWAMAQLGVDHLWKFITSPYQATNLRTGQKILFKGADDPTKLKSLNLSFGYVKYFWGEEVDQFGGPEDLRNFAQSLFRGGGTGQISFFSFNPPKSARSWANAEVKIPKPGRLVMRSTYETVNPAWLGERFFRDMEFLRQINPPAYRHEYLGEEIGTGLEVFNNVEIRAMDDDEVAALTNIRQGLDWGYAADPVWLGRVSYDRKRRWVYICGERSGVGVSNRALDDMTPEEWKRTLTVCDSSEPKSRDEMIGDYGWKMIAAAKIPGSVESGVKWLQGLAKIIIDPIRAPRAAHEFVNYALEVTRSGEVISRYPDKDNHAIDGTRYALEQDMRPEPVERPKLNVVPRVQLWANR